MGSALTKLAFDCTLNAFLYVALHTVAAYFWRVLKLHICCNGVLSIPSLVVAVKELAPISFHLVLI
jgi:hypothetical protein